MKCNGHVGRVKVGVFIFEAPIPGQNGDYKPLVQCSAVGRLFAAGLLVVPVARIACHANVFVYDVCVELNTIAVDMKEK